MEFSIAHPSEMILLVILLSPASYRITRLLVKDLIFDGPRAAIITKLVQLPDGGFRRIGFRAKLAYLIGCEFCVGVWVSLTLMLLALISTDSLTFGTLLIGWFAVAGVQAKLID